jgi:Pyruvate/2-oxoacid:ferredoxin oxidoreductase delta subunit
MNYISNLLEEFIDRYKFSTVYKEQNFPFYKRINSPIALDFMAHEKIINVLNSSAASGNNAIGFFQQTPDVPLINYRINNALILITFNTQYIYMPTIFVKSLEELTKSLSFAFNQSRKHKLPINIIISRELAVNTTKKLYIENVEFIKPTTTGIREMDIKNLIVALNNINEDFKNYFNNNIKHIDLFSLNDSRGVFFDCLVPMVQSHYKATLEEIDKLTILKDEEEFIKALCYQFDIDVHLNTVELPVALTVNDILCPGCPFLIIFKKQKLQNDNIYSNINCDTIRKIFQVKHINITDFIGLTIDKKEVNDLYISNLSDFEPSYLSKNIVYLNNFNIEQEKNFFNIIKKNKAVRQFEYSCNNIKKNKLLKVVQRKCKCMKEDKYPVCIKETLCPAIFISGQTVQINEKYCVGCKVCKIVCPYRAIK